LQGSWPTWSPDGARIAYSDGIRSVFVAGRHGENPRKVVTVDASPDQLRWLPDGNSLIFCEPDPKQETGVLLEVPANGGQIHLLRTIERRRPYSIPVWTSAGDYSIFVSGSTDSPEIWARRENCNPIRWRCREPARLTAAGGDYFAALPSRDGKKLFVLGRKTRREMERYDLTSGTFEPYLPSVLAADLDFSRDGKWVVYVHLPERTLWRSRTDGSNAAPLTFAGAEAYSPRWSPDGKRIAYMSISAQNQYKAYVVRAEGGQPQAVIPGEGEEGVPTWSRDGNFLAFGDTLHLGHASKMAIHLLDLRNHELSTLPGSARLWTPRWSPDGRYIAALALGDETKGQLGHCSSLLLYDFGKRSWTTLVNMPDIINVAWSRDSKCVYFLAGKPTRELYRVSLAINKIESLSSFRGSAEVGDDWIGVAPDGSPLVMMDIRIDEVYALDVQWP
jgi:Tol biopolymer transport system component